MAEEGAPIKTPEAEAAIATFLKELFPLVRDLHGLAVDVCDVRLGFLNSFYSAELNRLQGRHLELLARFMRAYRTWCNANELFKGFEGKNLQTVARMVADYANTKEAVGKHLDEGFIVLGQIDRILSDRKTTAYNRITMFIALVAIVISVLVAA